MSSHNTNKLNHVIQNTPTASTAKAAADHHETCKECKSPKANLKLEETSNAPVDQPDLDNKTLSKEDFTHPLDDLTEREIKVSVQLIKAELGFPRRIGFCQIILNEPPKEAVLDFDSGKIKGPIHREAFAIVLDHISEKTYEVIVALTPVGYEHVVSSVHIPGVQPPLLSNEYEICEDIVKNDHRVIDVLKKRGIDPDHVMVDLWIGFFSDPKDRIGAPLLFYRNDDESNGYAQPLDGIKVLVDLNKMKVLSVEELFDVPVPPHDIHSDWQKIKEYRQGLKPIHVTQPEGVSFEVVGRKLMWQNWSMRIGFNKREGLVLHTVSYNDKGKERPIIYRASIAEMVVPYGDPRHPNYVKNAFDAGEDGLGTGVHSLELGCDCLGAICYLDVVMNDGNGTPYTVKNGICIHEEDFGSLWKHKEWRNGVVGVRRSRRLVVSYFTTIANYDYGLFWYFYLDGTIKFEAKLTGIMSVSAIKSGEHPGGYGVMIAPGLYAPIHQHFFTARLDMMVDGFNNAVQEINVKPPDSNEPNPYHSAFYATKTTFHNEAEGQRPHNPSSTRCWRVVNTNSKNRNGEETSWRLVPYSSVLPYANHNSSIMFKACHLKNTVWVTPYNPVERYPAGNYTVQKQIDDGLTKWTKANRNVYNTNVVVWHNFGITHITRTEDWPVMPMEYCGFYLKPDNFFDWNPSMDVPPQPKETGCCEIPPLRAKL